MSDKNDGVEIPATVTPEWLATRGMVGDEGCVLLMRRSGGPLVRVPKVVIPCKSGEEEAVMHAWLAGWIRDGYEAGVQVAADRAREEGRAEAFRQVIEWCHAEVPEGGLTISVAEAAARDAVGALQQAAADGDDRVREEGRLLGWQEAQAVAARAYEAERKDADQAARVARQVREDAARADDVRERLTLRAIAAESVLTAMRSAAPKEPA